MNYNPALRYYVLPYNEHPKCTLINSKVALTFVMLTFIVLKDSDKSYIESNLDGIRPWLYYDWKLRHDYLKIINVLSRDAIG